MKYNPASRPAGIVEATLILAFYNAPTGVISRLGIAGTAAIVAGVIAIDLIMQILVKFQPVPQFGELDSQGCENQ